MRILSICNTPYQIMCVVNLKLNTYAEEEMDIIISDHMTNGEVLVKNIESASVFCDVYYVNSFDYCRRRGEYAKRYYRLVGGNTVLKKFVHLEKKYDLLLVSNVDPFADCVYERCYSQNKNVKVFAFEDGYGTYMYYGDDINQIRNNLKINSTAKLARLLGRKWIALHIDKMYFLAPDKIAWIPNFEVEQMPLISMGDMRLRNVLNQVFSYETMQDKYDEQYIFFEECYRREGIVLPDILLLEIIASIVGRENIMIKVHPRSNCKLFEELGYKTNKETFVPWEVIWMNEGEASNKTLITISSSSASTPWTMLNSRVQTIILKNLLYGIGAEHLGNYYQWLDDNVYKKEPEIFFLPNTLEELYTYFREERTSYEDSINGAN